MHKKVKKLNNILGFTGGIGSGKTAATNYFQQLGVPVIDADVIARQALEGRSSLIEPVKAHFGPSILNQQGQINRAALREIIFSHPEEKEWLENLVHPWIRQRLLTQLTDSSPLFHYIILSSPLLFETHQDQWVQRCLVIDCPEALQKQRASQRDQHSPESIQRIMDQQLPRPARLERADDILDNSLDLHHLYAQIDRLHHFYMHLDWTTHA